MKKRKFTSSYTQNLQKGRTREINYLLIILLQKLIKKYGLNYKKFQKNLNLSEERIHFLIYRVENLFPSFLKFNLKIFENNLFKNNQKYQIKNGIMPLEFYLANF